MNIFTKRILVANDVIAQVKMGRITPNMGTTLDFSVQYVLGKAGNKSAQEVLRDVNQCHACAVGTALICFVERFNQVPAKVLANIATQRIEDCEELLKVFPKTMLDEIEFLFERKRYNWSTLTLTQTAKLTEVLDSMEKDYNEQNSNSLPVKGFSPDYAKHRLITMMKKLIDNDGKYLYLPSK